MDEFLSGMEKTNPDGSPVTIIDLLYNKRYQELHWHYEGYDRDSDYYESDYYYSEGDHTDDENAESEGEENGEEGPEEEIEEHDEVVE